MQRDVGDRIVGNMLKLSQISDHWLQNKSFTDSVKLYRIPFAFAPALCYQTTINMTQQLLTSAQQMAGEYAECMRSVGGLYPESSGIALALYQDCTGVQCILSALSVHYQCIPGALNTWFGSNVSRPKIAIQVNKSS